MEPLQGKIVVVTRDAAQAGTLVEALRRRGAEPRLCPAIAVTAPASWAEVDAVLADWDRVAWVLFPSANAAVYFLDRLAARGWGAAAWAGKRVGVVGPATRALLEARGVRVDRVPRRFTGADLAAELAEELPAPEGMVVIPSSDIAREELAEMLTAAGWTVRKVVAYRTAPAPPPPEELARLAEADAVTFASPSAVRGFLAGAGADFFRRHPRVAAVSIGPATTRALAPVQAPVLLEADPHTVEGLVTALESHFRHPDP